MNILWHSYAFFPDRGGIESSSLLMVRECLRSGHEVRVVTTSPEQTEAPPCPVDVPIFRNPDSASARGLGRWADVIVQNHLSFHLLRPVYSLPRPVFIHFQTWLHRPERLIPRLAYRLRETLLLRCRLSANSRALAQSLLLPARVLGNPYDDRLFFPQPTPPERELLYVGRLVSDKGVDLLLEALAVLAGNNRFPRLTIVGSGPEEANLREQIRALGLREQVHLAGPAHGRDLADYYRSHPLLVVPSRWEEPFGIVALEGAACGCRIIGSDGGGLPDAIGPCGITFASGNPGDLAGKIERMLDHPDALTGSPDQCRQHLQQHRPAHFLKRLLQHHPSTGKTP